MPIEQKPSSEEPIKGLGTAEPYFPHKEKTPTTNSAFVDRIKTALRETEKYQDYAIPQVSERYLDIQERLIASEENGVTVFHGGPLDLVDHGVEDAWLIPVEISDEQGFSNFHVIAIGCNNGQDLAHAEVHVNFAPEISIRLGETANPETQKLNSLLLDSDRPRIIIRPSIAGSLAYPLITTPEDLPDTDTFKDRLAKLLAHFDFDSDVDQLDYSLVHAQDFDPDTKLGEFLVSEPRLVDAEIGTVWVYQVTAPENPWKYFEIYTFNNLDDLRKNDKLVVRTDSGCDIGMLYHDGGCDCHSQLLHALEEAKLRGGIVVHLPTQDGRGYGMNTKIETEGHKRGIDTVFNVGEPPMKTLEAAKRLFGEKYDIRTYYGVAKILAEMGFKNIDLITDNKPKFEQMQVLQLLVISRVTTGTLDHIISPALMDHVRDKHLSENYF